MNLELSKEDLGNILKLLWIAVQSPKANESFADFYVNIKNKFKVQQIMNDNRKKVDVKGKAKPKKEIKK